ncbi:MAG: (Fe-S)-binding protein [Phycisphaerae bacterium]
MTTQASDSRPAHDAAAALQLAAMSCIHCGLCLEECPTYLELGNEMDSPRGRILLMRSVAERRIEYSLAVRKHVDLCLGCRACEAVCPSGVPYGQLLEHTRADLRTSARTRASHGPARGAESVRRWRDRLLDGVIFHITPYRRRLRLAVCAGVIARKLGLMPLAARVAPPLAKAAAMLPGPQQAALDLAAATARKHGPRPRTDGRALPRAANPAGPVRATAQFFEGCATAELTPTTLANAHQVLLHNDCRVTCPRGQQCCGAVHQHGGRLAEARRFARRNIDAFDRDADDAAKASCRSANAPPGRARASSLDPEARDDARRTVASTPIVTIAAGCGAMLRGYGTLLADDAQYRDRAAAFAARVRDISEFLVALGAKPPTRPLPLRVTIHDACHHVHVQGIRAQPRALLRLIPGIELLEAPEAALCCGAAGSYNLTQPETAARLGRRKLANLASTGAACAAAGNVGCILHLNALRAEEAENAAAGAPPRVVHTIDLLHAAYELRV